MEETLLKLVQVGDFRFCVRGHIPYRILVEYFLITASTTWAFGLVCLAADTGHTPQENFTPLDSFCYERLHVS